MMSDATGLSWGTAEDMSAFEAVMWRADAQSQLRSTIVGLELLDSTPDWGRLVEAHNWATRMVPRLRKRVVETPFGFGPPRWSPDPNFDLHYHLRRARLPNGAGHRQLLATAEQLAMSPFDQARPPWEATLLEGLPDGKAAYLIKVHHSTTDGLGIVQLLDQLHSRTREHSADKPQPRVADIHEIGPLDALSKQINDDARNVTRLVSSASEALFGALRDPKRSLHDAVRYGRSLRRVLLPPAAAPSRLLSNRSPNWRFATLDVELTALRRAAKVAGGSLNDAFLAALLGGYRRYHDKLRSPIEAVPMAIPVSVRRAGDTEGGNRIASARLAGPVGIADPTERILAVRELIRRARAEPALDNIGMLSEVLARLPAPLIAKVAGDLAAGNDLQASNVPGIRGNVYLAGAHVDRIYPFAPLPRCPAMISLVTHGEHCCIGINFDPAACTDGELFWQCLADGLTEVLDLTAATAGQMET